MSAGEQTNYHYGKNTKIKKKYPTQPSLLRRFFPPRLVHCLMFRSQLRQPPLRQPLPLALPFVCVRLPRRLSVPPLAWLFAQLLL